MRRFSKGSARKLNADGLRLVQYADAALQAASRLEERSWEDQLDTILQKLLHAGQQEVLEAALEHTFKTRPAVYDVLMEALEANSESFVFTNEDTQWHGILIAAPILAWTRYSIAAGPIAPDLLSTLSAHLYAHVLAPDARMAMMPLLYAIDQLPQSHVATLTLGLNLAQKALLGGSIPAPTSLPETAPFLADTRFLLATVIAPLGEPLFRWQASLNLADRDVALDQWRAQAQPNVARLLPGCGIDLLLPEAYFVACREADKLIRPASIRASVYYLTNTLNVDASELQAIVGGFGDEASEGRIDEYRVGFALTSSPEVIYGVIWPLFGPEEADVPAEEEIAALTRLPEDLPPAVTPLEEIMALLRESGVTNVKQHDGCFPMEACDDCGVPFYLDVDAELVHPEMPEEFAQGPAHFH